MSKQHKWSGRQIKALKSSIRHWERMRDDMGCEEEPVAGDCACCKAYPSELYCGKCPIAVFTGHGHCARTPFYTASGDYYCNPGRFPAAAQKEIDFLNKVLKAGS